MTDTPLPDDSEGDRVMHSPSSIGILGAALLQSGLLSRAPSPEQLEQMRLERLAAIAAQRAASPHVAAAEAKRARKAAKLSALTREAPHE